MLMATYICITKPSHNQYDFFCRFAIIELTRVEIRSKSDWQHSMKIILYDQDRSLARQSRLQGIDSRTSHTGSLNL